MRRLLLTALALALVPAALRAQKKPEALWYYVDTEESWNDLQKHIDRIDIVAPDVFGVDSLGVVWGELDPRVLALARQHHVQVMPLIVNKPFDYKALHVFLSNDAYVRRAVAPSPAGEPQRHSPRRTRRARRNGTRSSPRTPRSSR